MLALVLCTSERCPGFQGASVTMSVASHEAMIEDLQDICHQLIVPVSIRSTCHYTKQYQ